MRHILNTSDFIGLGATVASGVLLGLLAASVVFAAVAKLQNWWKDR